MEFNKLTMLEKLLIVRQMIEAGELALLNMDGYADITGSMKITNGEYNFYVVVEK
jgi:hypothetical protein